MPFSPSSSPCPKQAQPSTARRYNGWPGASWGSSWTEKPKADTELARRARRRHVSKLKLSLHSAQNCPWRLLAPRSSRRTALPHGAGPGWYTSILKLCEEKTYHFYGCPWERIREMGFVCSLTNTQANCPNWLIQSCDTHHNKLSWSVEPRIQRRVFFLHTHPQQQ